MMNAWKDLRAKVLGEGGKEGRRARLPWPYLGAAAALALVLAIALPLFLARPVPSASGPKASAAARALLEEMILPAPDPLLPDFAFQRDPSRRYTEKDIAEAWFDPKEADLSELSRKNLESLEAALEAAE
jgi:hypothetical protein